VSIPGLLTSWISSPQLQTRSLTVLPDSGILKVSWESMFESESDYRYFKLFESKTAKSLSGYFDTDLWGRLILQTCEHEEFAKHGVLALAALNKTIETSAILQVSSGSTENLYQTVNSHHEVALKHYAKSLKLMRHRTADVSDEHHLRNILVSCLLTVCFENYHGNERAALAQAVSGIRLLSQFQEERMSDTTAMPTTSSNSPLSTIDPDLINAFTGLEVVVMHVMESIPEQRHLSKQMVHDAKALDTMPSEFSTLKEARYYWDILLRRLMLLFRDELNDPRAEPLPQPEAGATPGGDVPPEIHEHRTRPLTQWQNACQPLFESLRNSPGHKDRRGEMLLKMFFLVSFRSSPSTSDSQIIKDSAELVQLAKEIIQPSNTTSDSMDEQRPVFAFDGRLILVIFRVAIRCRIRHIRREAIGLLKIYRWREGFCDSEMAATVAQWFVDTEEEGLSMDEEVSPDSRLVLVSNQFVLAERKTLVQCARQVKGQPTELLEPVLLRW
jgi:hypothetical protein